MKRWIVGFAVAAMLVLTGRGRAGTILDNFDDGILAPAWQVVTQSQGASWDESGGALNVGGASGQTEQLVMKYNLPLAEVGSVRIDYNWISYSGHKARVGLGLFDSSWPGEGDNQVNLQYGIYIKGVRYRTEGLHAVDGGGTDVGYQIAYSVPTSGSLMIERNGNDFWARYLDGANWQDLFHGQRDFAGTPIYPYLFTSNSDTNPSWQVALDNFQADVIPEPSTLILLSMGALAVTIGWWRRRRAA